MGDLSAMVGARIRELRAARGWSLSSLAERAGVGKATLSEIESGQRNPTLETLYAIAAPLRVGLSALLAEPAQAPSVHGDAVDGTLVAVHRDPTVVTEIYRLRIRPGHGQVSPAHGLGVIEHLLVTAGVVRVGPVGAMVEVAAGADHTWESDGPHGYQAIGGVAEAVLVIRHPR
jgi:transcriptional regulator with XRE-family HTH domain